jgi:hypothetical protein
MAYVLLISALAGGEWSDSRPGRITPGERAPGIRWTGGSVDPRTGLQYMARRTFLTLSGPKTPPLQNSVRCQPKAPAALYSSETLFSASGIISDRG